MNSSQFNKTTRFEFKRSNLVSFPLFLQSKQVKDSFLPLCDLCQKLHLDLSRKEYPDFQEWIRDQMICIDYSILPWFKQESEVTTTISNEPNEQNQVHVILGNLIRIQL